MAIVTRDENASRLAAAKRLATASSFSVSPVKGLPRCRSAACRKLNGMGFTIFQLEWWHKYTFVPPILSFLFLLVSAVGIYLLFSVGLRWLGWVWIAYLCWHYYSRFSRGRIFAKEQAQLSRLGQLLGQVQDEVDSGNYDAQEVAGRLR